MNDIDWMLPENRIKTTPLLLLKQGLEQGRWDAISFAYMILTGDKINVPEQKTDITIPTIYNKLVENIKDIVSEEMLDFADDNSFINPKEVIEELPPQTYDDEGLFTNKKVETIIKGKTKKVNVKGNKNKFIDDPEEASEDNSFLPKDLSKVKKIGIRPPHGMVKCTCRQCHKEEMVDAELAPKMLDQKYRTSYKCNDCCCFSSGES